MKFNRVHIEILSIILLFFVQLNDTKKLQIPKVPGIEIFNARLQVLKENLTLQHGVTTQCQVITEESKKPWNETEITEVETGKYDKIRYFNVTASGCFNFDVRSQRVTLALTDSKYTELPRYAIFLHFPNVFGDLNMTYSMIRKQVPPTNDVEIAITPGILDNSEYRSFSLNWGNGTISISKNDNKTPPFLTFHDDDITDSSLTLVGLKSYDEKTASWKLKDLGKPCGGNKIPGTVQTLLVQCWAWKN